MQIDRIDVGGLTLACRKAGKPSDPCLVLLHGWPQTGLAWEGVLPELGKDSYALAFDLPDVGDSQGAPRSVAGHERAYFDFFYNVMASDPKRLPEARRDAYAKGYARREALQAGFDWYRAMPKDAEHNATRAAIKTPMLYLRGDAGAAGKGVEEYVGGLKKAGAIHLETGVLPNSGEYAPEEAPGALVEALRRFRRSVTSASR